MKEIVVYGGPSLPIVSRDELYRLRPPMRRGDLTSTSTNHIVVLLDGLFLQSPAVTHQEILQLLDRGITVIGAASMGAQRAAELEPFGMIGCGTVYKAITKGFVTDDSELAVGVCPFTHQALTTPLVEVRRLLALVPHEVNQLDIAFEAAQNIHFLDRTAHRLLSSWAKACPKLAATLVPLYHSPYWRIKRDDAHTAINLALALQEPGQQDLMPRIESKLPISLYVGGGIEHVS